MKFKVIAIWILVIILYSCNNVQSRLDNLVADIEYAEQNEKSLTAQDYTNLEKKIDDLDKDFELNRDNYNDEQVKTIGKIKGKYASLAAKKGINDLQESIKDLGNQVDGFIEGITDTIK